MNKDLNFERSIYYEKINCIVFESGNDTWTCCMWQQQLPQFIGIGIF